MTPSASVVPRAIIALGEVGSTQDVAFALAARGAADGTVVTAASQTAGRGRRGRGWHDERGASLLASIVMRPRTEPARWPALSLVAGIAVAEALHGLTGLDARLKWPNDVLVAGRKIAGILLEGRPAEAVAIVGVGVNLTQRGFGPELAARATSVMLETARAVAPATALDALLPAFDAWRMRFEAEGVAPVRERWLALAHGLGTAATVDGVDGVIVDLDPDGALVLDRGGRRHRVVAGELRHAGEEAGGMSRAPRR
jgi:BirA family biotin operon repressor/biotin-[acetyl-CoA-carboxylase] ligase